MEERDRKAEVRESERRAHNVQYAAALQTPGFQPSERDWEVEYHGAAGYTDLVVHARLQPWGFDFFVHNVETMAESEWSSVELDGAHDGCAWSGDVASDCKALGLALEGIAQVHPLRSPNPEGDSELSETKPEDEAARDAVVEPWWWKVGEGAQYALVEGEWHHAAGFLVCERGWSAADEVEGGTLIYLDRDGYAVPLAFSLEPEGVWTQPLSWETKAPTEPPRLHPIGWLGMDAPEDEDGGFDTPNALLVDAVLHAEVMRHRGE